MVAAYSFLPSFISSVSLDIASWNTADVWLFLETYSLSLSVSLYSFRLWVEYLSKWSFSFLQTLSDSILSPFTPHFLASHDICVSFYRRRRDTHPADLQAAARKLNHLFSLYLYLFICVHDFSFSPHFSPTLWESFFPILSTIVMDDSSYFFVIST